MRGRGVSGHALQVGDGSGELGGAQLVGEAREADEVGEADGELDRRGILGWIRVPTPHGGLDVVAEHDVEHDRRRSRHEPESFGCLRGREQTLGAREVPTLHVEQRRGEAGLGNACEGRADDSRDLERCVLAEGTDRGREQLHGAGIGVGKQRDARSRGGETGRPPTARERLDRDPDALTRLLEREVRSSRADEPVAEHEGQPVLARRHFQLLDGGARGEEVLEHRALLRGVDCSRVVEPETLEGGEVHRQRR